MKIFQAYYMPKKNSETINKAVPYGQKVMARATNEMLQNNIAQLIPSRHFLGDVAPANDKKRHVSISDLDIIPKTIECVNDRTGFNQSVNKMIK